MTDYTITTNFGAKDSLPSGNAAKVIKGSEFTTEFTNIATAVNSKADTAGDTFTGVVNFSADVAFDTDTLFVDVSTDRVGIGTNTPTTALEVTGGLIVDTDTLYVDDTNDRVGIGTTSPQGNLHISAGTDGDATLILETDTDQGGSEADNPRIELRQDGHEVEGSIYMEGDADQTATNSIVNSLIIDSKNYSGNNYMQFATGGIVNPSSPALSTVKMTITPDGQVLIGTASTSLFDNTGSGANSNGVRMTQDGLVESARYAATAASFNRMANDGATVNFYNRGVLRGYINTNQNGASLISFSDQRLKENVTDSGDAGSTIDSIQVRQFDWIADGKHQDYGFVAQELANAVPDAVFTGEDEDETMGVDYSKLVPILVKEVQALRSRVAQLEESE